MPTTRHGQLGWPARPAGSFAGKADAGGRVVGPFRHGLTGWVTRTASFSAKTAADGTAAIGARAKPLLLSAGRMIN